MATSMPASTPMGTAAIYDERVAVVLGFLTLFSLLAVFLSCRSFLAVMNRMGLEGVTNSKAYRRFYQYHAYYWWIFGALILSHFMMAVLHTGLPKAGDPDSPIHWAILLLGLGAALGAGALFVSCRIMPRLITLATSKNPMTSVAFKGFFKLHAYYWWIILLLVVAHFAASYLHTGFWPR